MNESILTPNVKNQNDTTVWEILNYVIKIFFHDMQYWFLFNLAYLGYSLGIITIPAAKLSMTAAIWEGLEDVDAIKKEDSRKMRDYLKQNFLKSFSIFFIKTFTFGIIAFSIVFWISRPEKVLHFISILSIYGLLLAWMTNFYLLPVLVEDQTRSVFEACKIAFKTAFTKPFESMLFSSIDFVLFVVEVILFGPLMVILPSLRKILSVLGYWYVSNQEIPMVACEFQGFKFLKPKE